MTVLLPDITRDQFKKFSEHVQKTLIDTLSTNLTAGKLNNIAAKLLGYQNYHVLSAKFEDDEFRSAVPNILDDPDGEFLKKYVCQLPQA